jgi:hypothetical protein
VHTGASHVVAGAVASSLVVDARLTRQARRRFHRGARATTQL